MCHSYRLSLSNLASLTIFEKGNTLPWEGEGKMFIKCKIIVLTNERCADQNTQNLALLAIPQPAAWGFHTGGHGRANRRV